MQSQLEKQKLLVDSLKEPEEGVVEVFCVNKLRQLEIRNQDLQDQLFSIHTEQAQKLIKEAGINMTSDNISKEFKTEELIDALREEIQQLQSEKEELEQKL